MVSRPLDSQTRQAKVHFVIPCKDEYNDTHPPTLFSHLIEVNLNDQYLEIMYIY